MKQTILLIITLAFPGFSFAQQVSYNDVAVIVNDSSQTSIDIGNYFAQQRNIPSQNIIHVTTTTQEEIDTAQLFDLLSQVSNYLSANNLDDSINYIVTTKGVPLKVAFGNCAFGGRCSSVEFEMALILGPYSNSIAMGGSIYNPYLGSQTNFARSIYHIFLVTRLDGYSYDDVITLIDRSGPNIPVIKSQALFVFDFSHLGYNVPSVDSSFMRPAADTLTKLGWEYVFDGDTATLLNQSNVMGLYSFDLNSSGQNLNYNWLRGSIVKLCGCNSSATFDESENVDENYLVADAVKEGATGAEGWAYCGYAATDLIYEIVLSRYLDTANHFNLAESYYAALPGLSWPHEIIGDPKTSIVIDTLNGISPIANSEIKLYPNPSSGIFQVSFPSTQNCYASVWDVLGQIMWEEKWITSNKVHSINLQSQPAGIYFLKVKQGDEERVVKLVKD
ncbi:MAG TPA: TIGR03790 family protein [Chitinophagales bacterium]|nr:TIGR03790 family protein [Chitinophagales bacterium]